MHTYAPHRFALLKFDTHQHISCIFVRHIFINHSSLMVRQYIMINTHNTSRIDVVVLCLRCHYANKIPRKKNHVRVQMKNSYFIPKCHQMVAVMWMWIWMGSTSQIPIINQSFSSPASASSSSLVSICGVYFLALSIIFTVFITAVMSCQIICLNRSDVYLNRSDRNFVRQIIHSFFCCNFHLPWQMTHIENTPTAHRLRIQSKSVSCKMHDGHSH